MLSQPETFDILIFDCYFHSVPSSNEGQIV